MAVPVAAIAGAASSAFGAMSPAPGAPQSFNPNTPINVAPVGVNLGEILKGYEQGSAVNGGSGANIPSRYAQQFMDNAANNVPAKEEPGNGNGQMLLITGIAIAGGLAAYWIMR